MCTHNHGVHYWKTTFRAPCLSGVSPYKTTHITTVWTHTTTVYLTGKLPKEPRVYQGRPPSSKNTNNHCVNRRIHCVSLLTSRNYWKTTFRAPCLSRDPPPINTHNHYVGGGKRNHCVGLLTSRNYWKTTFRAPCLSRVPPPHEHTQPPCGHTDPLCGCIHLKNLLENNYQSPMFSSPPSHQHTQPLTYISTVCPYRSTLRS